MTRPPPVKQDKHTGGLGVVSVKIADVADTQAEMPEQRRLPT
jgi:hypothetical protein